MDQMGDFEQQGHVKVSNATMPPNEGRITSKVNTNPCHSTTPSGHSRHNTSPWQQASASEMSTLPEMSTLQRDPVRQTRVPPSGSSDMGRKFADRVSPSSNVSAKPLRPKWDETANVDTGASVQKASVKMEEFIDLTQPESTHETNIDSVSRVRQHNLPCETGITASNLGISMSLEGVTSTEIKPGLTRPNKSLSFIKGKYHHCTAADWKHRNHISIIKLNCGYMLYNPDSSMSIVSRSVLNQSYTVSISVQGCANNLTFKLGEQSNF